MALLVYKPDTETAHRILNFFEANPHKDYCVVGIGQGEEVIYWRKDIPRLSSLSASNEKKEDFLPGSIGAVSKRKEG